MLRLYTCSYAVFSRVQEIFDNTFSYKGWQRRIVLMLGISYGWRTKYSILHNSLEGRYGESRVALPMRDAPASAGATEP